MRPSDKSMWQGLDRKTTGISPIIRSARSDEVAAVGALVALSFSKLDALAYLVPTEAERELVSRDYFALYAEHAVEHGRIDGIDMAEGLAAVAVWFDCTDKHPGIVDYENRLADVVGQYLDQFQRLDLLLASHHPVEPHWYLAFLAVHPNYQKIGLGGALAKHFHDELDADKTPAYLEASNEASARLYRRLGYQAMNPFAISLPNGTPFFRMWRSSYFDLKKSGRGGP